jgi:hypothetical protein
MFKSSKFEVGKVLPRLKEIDDRQIGFPFEFTVAIEYVSGYLGYLTKPALHDGYFFLLNSGGYSIRYQCLVGQLYQNIVNSHKSPFDFQNFIKLEHITFGGDLIVFGGDFRQVLSVLPRGTCAQIVDQCMNRSVFWRPMPRTTNVQAYSRFIYLNLPATLDLDVVAGHEDLERVDAWNGGRRLVFVGTSAPQTTFDRPAYQGRLDEEVSPVTNLTTESESSPALNTVLNIATDDGDDEAEYEDDETPPFIDHHPRIVSERFRDMAQNLNVDALVHDDQALKDSIAALNRDVIVMLDSRPTMMFPHIQRRNFLVGVCPYIDIYFYDNNRCGLVLWWPDAANGKWLSKCCNTLMKQIGRLSSMKLRLLICRMQQHWPNAIGIPPEHPQTLREWLNDHPTSIQSDLMLRELSSMWNDSGNAQVDRVGQYLLYRMFDVSLPRVERQQRLLPLVPDDIAEEMPELSMTQVMRNWSASRRSALVNETLGRVPNFNSLSQGQKAQLYNRAGKLTGND